MLNEKMLHCFLVSGDHDADQFETPLPAAVEAAGTNVTNHFFIETRKAKVDLI